ncbi:MAG: LLM class flavin-dependent oxidoreductase [Chloroflexi bacterium]|nr:LLM class flavin-dependent oxidoreductase [Chloroflexota bacterium]
MFESVEQCNFLDLALRGRCIVGLGPGLSFVEYGGFGQSVPERYALMDRNLDIFFRALAHTAQDPPLHCETPSGEIELNGRINPASFRKPHPQLGRASSREASIVDTAGQGWVSMTSRLGAEDLAPRFAVALYARSLQEAELDPHQVRFCLGWSAAMKAAYAKAPGSLPQALPSIPPDHDAFVRCTMLVGSPESVTARIEAHERAGIRHVAAQFLNGYVEDDKVAASFDLFMERVLPRFPRPSDAFDPFLPRSAAASPALLSDRSRVRS